MAAEWSHSWLQAASRRRQARTRSVLLLIYHPLYKECLEIHIWWPINPLRTATFGRRQLLVTSGALARGMATPIFVPSIVAGAPEPLEAPRQSIVVVFALINCHR